MPDPKGYRPIRDYAILGDGHTAALVARDGSIDWCCWPRFDSGAVFCRILDQEKGGWCRVGPATPAAATREYAGETNVLVSTHQTDSGTVRITDFMPIDQHSGRKRGRELAPTERILRLVEGIGGTSKIAIEFRPTFDFARARTSIELHAGGAVASAGGEFINLSCPAGFRIDDDGCARGTLEVKSGERVWIAITYGRQAKDASKGKAAAANGDRDLDATLRYWNDWIAECRYDGPYPGLVRRSALALKLLIYSPTGALVAAPTASLPEDPGGVRNWDYRYTWLRDSSLILHALETIGYYDEALNFFEWLERLDLRNRGKFQIMYTIEGDAELPEITLDHLEGYRGSRPVRIGNDASSHVQVDIYGEVLEAAYLCFKKLRKEVHGELWKMLSHLADSAAANWHKPDRSIWEFRSGPRQFTYSKLLCWVAMDRAIRLAEEVGLPANLPKWRAARDEIRHALLTKGYNKDAGAFTQTFGSRDVDASALAFQRLGFLPPGDPRIVSTTEAVWKHLGRDGQVYRYLNDDGLPGREGTFNLCTLWMVMNVAGQGRTDEARELFERFTAYASNEGLFSEEIDPRTGDLLGNYPQGFTHLGLIRAAAKIGEMERAAQSGGEMERRTFSKG